MFGALLLFVAALWIWTRFGADLWNDHIQYWSAARVLLDGGNPYDPSALLDAQLAAGRQREDAILMWNPPWVLTLFVPLALGPDQLRARLVGAGSSGRVRGRASTYGTVSESRNQQAGAIRLKFARGGVE